MKVLDFLLLQYDGKYNVRYTLKEVTYMPNRPIITHRADLDFSIIN